MAQPTTAPDHPVTVAPDVTLTDALQQPVWTMLRDGAIDYANPFLRAYTGLDVADLLGDGWVQVVHPDDIPALQDLLSVSLAAGTGYEAEFRLRRSDGAYRWHLARVALITGADGVVGWVGSGIDIDGRRLAEEALRNSEARARDLVDNASELVYTLALDGTVTAMNPAIEQLLGYRPEEIQGRRIDAYIAPDQLAYTRGMLAAKIAGEAVSRYDLDLIAKDGRRVTLEISSRLAMDDGRPVAVHGVARDVSGRRAAVVAERERNRQIVLAAAVASAVTAALAARDPLQVQLQRSAEALASHVDAAVVRIWTLDPDGETLSLQASAGDYPHLDGPQARLAVGERRVGMIAAERRPYLTNAVMDEPEVSDPTWAEREGIVAFAGYPLLVGGRVNGVLGLLARHVVDAATLDLLGSVADVLAVGIDRARIEATRDASLLRERAARRDAEDAQRRYRALFEGVADAILVVDDTGAYRDANQAALELLGYSRDELLGMATGDLAAHRERAVDEWARFNAEGHWGGEMELRRKDGSTVAVEIRATVVDLPDGPLRISAMREVEERRAMERRQQEFLEAVSHDLKNPLAAVRAQAQLLGRRVRRGAIPTADALASASDTIATATHRMEAQLDEFQDVLRLRSGAAIELEPSLTDLVDLASRAVTDAQTTTGHHRLRLRARVEALPAVVDPLRIRRVVDNLLGNAIKYSPDGGTIEVDLARIEAPDGAWAELIVRDEGVGIPADDLPHVFERYRRGSNVGRDVRGSGVGLSGVRRIVEQHGGTVAVQSVEGAGSIFTVRLPLDPRPETREDLTVS